MVVVVIVVVAAVVVAVVVLMLTRIVMSVVTGQAPVTLEWNTPEYIPSCQFYENILTTSSSAVSSTN